MAIFLPIFWDRRSVRRHQRRTLDPQQLQKAVDLQKRAKALTIEGAIYANLKSNAARRAYTQIKTDMGEHGFEAFFRNSVVDEQHEAQPRVFLTIEPADHGEDGDGDNTHSEKQEWDGKGA